MLFSKQIADQALESVVESISNALQDGKHILWLVSGGSAIGVQCKIMERVVSKTTGRLSNLSILPVDERFGTPGHADSNTAQMQRAGFDPKEATWRDILSGHSMSDVVSEYAELAESLFAKSNLIIATLGLGPDAHTAGLLPSSPAVTDSVSTVIGYSWSDYERMTLGTSMLKRIEKAYVFAYGESKQSALQRLQQNAEPIENLPSKILYDIPEVTVYNDFVESEG